VNKTRSLHIFIYIELEDINNQQWSWAMAVGAVFALYRVCSLYSWMANIGNIRFRPQQSPLAMNAVPPHPSKLTLPAFWISEPAAWFALAEAKFRPSQRVMLDLLVTALSEKNLSQGDGHHQEHPSHQPHSRSSSSGSWRPTCCPTRRRWTPCSSKVP
jgi:hypothetical protein